MKEIFWKLSEVTPNCAGLDPLLFIGPDGEGRSDREYREEEAKRSCVGCPLLNECLEWAIVNTEVGIWGGTNDEEREASRFWRDWDAGRLTWQQKRKLARQKKALRMYERGALISEISASLHVTDQTAYGYIHDLRMVIRSGEASSDQKADSEAS